MANRVNPDQTLNFAASDLGLHCLLKHISPKTDVNIHFWNKYGKNLLVQIFKVNTVILMRNLT